MEVNPITAAQAASQANGTSQVAAAKLADNFDNFLQLLTTQLKNQDPMSPLDSTDFVAQLVRFSEVEQSINTNKKLDKLLALQQGSLTTVGLGYIGKSVEAKGAAAPLQDGKIAFSYTLAGNAVATTIAIANQNGDIVFSTAGQTAKGQYEFAWDGTDGNGTPVPPGVYRIAVGALDSKGEQVGVSTTATARVTGVESGEGGPLLLFGDVKVPLDNVISVHEPPSPPGG